MPPKSNQTRRSRKLTPPARPDASYPLSAHASGKFQKQVKVRGKLKTLYFGAWAKRIDGVLTVVEDGGWRDALTEYENWKRTQDNLDREAAALRSNEELKQRRSEEERIAKLEADASGELRLRELCNLYLEYGKSRVKQKDLKPKSFLEYVEMTDLVLSVLNRNMVVRELKTGDFAKIRERMAIDKEWSPARIGKFIGLIGTMFNVACENEWIESKPRFGAGFKRPSKERCDDYANEGGDKLFTRDEILKLLNGGWINDKKKGRIWVGPKAQLRAAILLGCNCAFGNTDVSVVTVEAFDFNAQLVRLPRTKTSVKRENPLWPETIEAVKAVLAERPASELPNLFLTRFGRPWVHGKTDAISRQFGALMRAHNIAPNIRNAGFYVLRHCFSTVGREVGDRDGLKAILGHKDKDITSRYIHGMVPLKQRVAVSNHVRDWLFNNPHPRTPK